MREIEEIVKEFNKDNISEMNAENLLSIETLQAIMYCEDEFERQQLESMCAIQAQRLKMGAEFKKVLKQYKLKLAKENDVFAGNYTNFSNQPITLRCGDWVCNDNGVRKNIYNSSKGIYETKIASSIPLTVTELMQSADDGTERIKLAFYKNGKWQHTLCNRSIVASNTKIIELADKGIEVTSDNAKLLVKYISDLVALNLSDIPKYKAVNKMGWHGNEFMPYSDMRFDGENEYNAIYSNLQEKGNIKDWVEFTSELRKNITLRLLMSASFAAPLLTKVNAQSFIVHLWGGTGAGKTVALMVAASIWGNPLLGEYTRTIDGTTNSIINIASFLNNLPFVGDELQTVKTECGYDKLIMKCTEGVGRSRMKFDKVQKLEKWKTVFLFTGEESITRETSGGGAKNRVVEIECSEKIINNGNSVVEFISQNYGLVGKNYIGCIKFEDLKTLYSATLNDVLCNTEATDKQAMAVSCMLLADKLVCKYIYKDENALTTDDIKEIVKANKEVDISERAFEFVSGLISENCNKFIGSNMGETWGKIEKEYIYINKNVLVREMRKAGFEFDAVKRRWADKGYLILNSQGRVPHNTKCFGIKSAYIKLKV